ncbi:MAG: plastocyanin/azurin family copper-binding protein [bacterium]|nr:plastocyanin/azurin family copper-binding protein [bacterium]
MNNTLIAIIVVVVLAIGGFFLFQNKGVAPVDDFDPGSDPGTIVNTTMPVPGSDVVETVVIKEFSVDAAPFSFSPSTMTVNKGDTVRITLKNTKGTHDLKIDEFNATTRILNAGETQTITFLANKTGTFDYYCSVGNHRAMGMVGKLIVR